MRLFVVNPNTTAAMTARIGETARAVAAPGTEILLGQSAAGPDSIEGYFDEAISLVGLLEAIAAAEADGVDGHVLACFDDGGLAAARCLATQPVIGIGEAAFHVASLVAHRFTVVTTLARSVPAIEENLVRYGLAARCARVRAVDLPVLSLEAEAAQARTRIGAAIEAAMAEERADAIVLGCAGMTNLASDLSSTFGLPVIDGVAAAVKLAEGLAGLGLKTAKTGPYAPPRPKRYLGLDKLAAAVTARA